MLYQYLRAEYRRCRHQYRYFQHIFVTATDISMALSIKFGKALFERNLRIVFGNIIKLLLNPNCSAFQVAYYSSGLLAVPADFTQRYHSNLHRLVPVRLDIAHIIQIQTDQKPILHIGFGIPKWNSIQKWNGIKLLK